MPSRRWGSAILGLVLAIAATGCPPDPCEGVDCSGQGTCVAVEGEAGCDCDPGFVAAGTTCEAVDPCEGVDCSGLGLCVELDGAASCDCELTYHAEGLECVADELPALSCEGGWVTGHLADPVTTPGRPGGGAPPALRLRARTLGAGAEMPCMRDPGPEGELRIVHLPPGSPASALFTAGVVPLESMGHGYRLVWLPPSTDAASLCALPGLRTVTTLTEADRIDDRLARASQGETVRVAWFRIEDHGDGPEVRRRDLPPMPAGEARELADDPATFLVQDVTGELIPLNDVARRSVRTEEVQAADLDADPPEYDGPVGRGIVVGIVDTGVDADHPDLHLLGAGGSDLGTRVVGDEPYQGDGHGTMVAGAAAGNGWASEGVSIEDQVGGAYQWRGHAPAITRVASVVMSPSPWSEVFLTQNAFVSNHSYTMSQGDYSVSVAHGDTIVREGAAVDDTVRPPRVSVFAAANNGTHGNNGIEMRGYHSIFTPGKNGLCVGGSHANDDTYSMGASAGPTLDGRIKPDLIAPGFKQYRPLDGVPLAIDEIRLVAHEGSGAEDRVWGFDDNGDAEGWSAGSALEDLEVLDGVLSTVAVGADDQEEETLVFDFVSADGVPLAATDYGELQVTLRLEVGGDPEEHRWPWFWVVGWDGADDGWDANLYPDYDPALQDDGWHTHGVSLADSGAWSGDVARLRVWPTSYDYRIVTPDIGGGYGRSGGTSLAAPVVTGVVAMTMEALESSHGTDIEHDPPRPSLFKALLLHTARDRVHPTPYRRDPPNPDTGVSTLYHEGPDFASGYGLLDAWAALTLVAADTPSAAKWRETSLDHGEEHLYAIPVVDELEAGPLKVTVAWDDVAGSSQLALTEPVLVNDLDVILLGPDGAAHGPWILDPLPFDDDDPWDGIEPIAPDDVVPARRCVAEVPWDPDQADECEDHRNNVEQIVVDSPTPGWYLLRIRGFEVPDGPQPYSLVVAQECG